MAKSTSYNFQKSDRKKIVENCKECGGNPPIGEFNLQGLCGQHCTNEDCMIVINWRKEGKPIQVISKRQVILEGPVYTQGNTVVEVKMTPGKQIDFTNLKSV